MIEFFETKKPITLKEIKEIEGYVGLTFPDDYKQHLLKYNGGWCKPNVFSLVEERIENYSCIDRFYAIYDGEYDNLKEFIDIFKKEEKRMPIHITPIAHDPGGNQICISCGIKDYGYIYFWDHENEVDYTVSGDDDYSNLYLIAKSFNEFLEGLTPVEDD